MQPMSDKELDNLFQQQFEAFEPVVPSKLWAGIAEQLEEKKAVKKSFPMVWMAAASVVLVAFSSVWLYTPKATLKLHAKNTVKEVPAPQVQKQEAPAASPVEQAEQQVMAMTAPAPAPVRATLSVAKESSRSERSTVTPAVVTVPEQRTEQADVVQRVTTPVQTLASSGFEESNPVNSTPVIASIASQDLYDQDVPRTKSRGPKSLVGLVNYVVGKVDPRADKIIELTDTDEGTEVSGINLGLLRIKSKLVNADKH